MQDFLRAEGSLWIRVDGERIEAVSTLMMWLDIVRHILLWECYFGGYKPKNNDEEEIAALIIMLARETWTSKISSE